MKGPQDLWNPALQMQRGEDQAMISSFPGGCVYRSAHHSPGGSGIPQMYLTLHKLTVQNALVNELECLEGSMGAGAVAARLRTGSHMHIAFMENEKACLQ